ncbi:MAG: folate-binding protein YgfZ [Candidatus Angelobacter sp. Gp1-AA117]|nr:MAG: folate-binding protein YgfZ [Candidatus Angelobacter sp. Gp1-AA117]
MTTALQQRLTSGNVRIGSYSGADTVLAFADPAHELQALNSGCGVFDLNWRAKIIVTGEDRVRWLNGMVTNNVRDLPLNHGNYNFLLNPQGRILADMYIYNRGEYLLLDTDRSQLETVMKTLDHFIIMDDVELADSSETLGAIGICGPKAADTLHELSSLHKDASAQPGAAAIHMLHFEEHGPLEVRDLVINNIGISVVRGPQQKPGWHEIWAASANLEPLWEMIEKAGAQPVGAEALESWRILRGIPRYGQDIRERDLPQETEQHQALNFLKGCYIGQEIVERIRSRGQVHRKFTGFEFKESLPQPGKIEEGGKVVAEITSTARIPSAAGEKKIGLGYVRRESAPPGSQIQLNGTSATVLDPPFAF